MQNQNLPKNVNRWIPEQIFKKLYPKRPKGMSYDEFIKQFWNQQDEKERKLSKKDDLKMKTEELLKKQKIERHEFRKELKKQEKEINELRKQINKYNKKDERFKYLNKEKTYEYEIDVRIYKIYHDNENKRVFRHWQFLTNLHNTKYVIFKMFKSFKMKPNNLEFLNYNIEQFYNDDENPEIINSFRNAFFDSFEINKLNNDILYLDGFIIDNIAKIEVKKYKKMDLKNVKYKNDSDKCIYSPYTNYTINLNAKLFQDVFSINLNDYLQENYRKNCCLLTCIINKFYDRFASINTYGKKKYKNNLTYGHLCKILNIEEKESDMAVSINDVMPFFEKYKLGFIVYNQFMKEIHTFKPEKQPEKYQILRILVKDNHVYELTDKLLSLKQINISENIKVSNKYYINEHEDTTINKFKFLITNGIKDIIHYIKLFKTKRQLFTEIQKSDKFNNLIKLKFISNDDLNDLLIEIVNNKYVPKVFYNNYVYKIELKIEFLFISIESVDISTQNEPLITINSIEEYEQFIDIDKKFKSNFIKNDYLSVHHESVIKIEDVYKINAISGHLEKSTKSLCGLDIRKAYSSFLSNINVVPIFSYFDVYKKYNNEPIENYTYYIIEILNGENSKSTLIFNEKYTRVYGFLLKNLDEEIKYKILYFRKPFKLEEVNFKQPIEELYNNNKSIDTDLKKYIANKLTGILELKRNKSHISKIYNSYEHALHYQNLYGGKIIPINKYTDKKSYKKSDEDDGEILETFKNTSEVKFYLLNVDKEERLINGFTPIKDIIYCMQKIKIMEMYNKLIRLKLKVVGIKTDCVFYEGNNDIVEDNFDLSNKVGNYKIEYGKYTMDVKLFVKENKLIDFIDFNNLQIKTFEDEYNTKDINEYLIQNKRVMIKSLYPGSGKSQSIKNLGLKTLFVLPENKNAQDILNEKNKNVNAITFSKLFGLYADDIELEKRKLYDISEYEAIFFDEICKHSPDRLKRIANFIINNPKLLIFGGGDYKQIAPINFEGNTKYLDDCLNVIFPNQILFKEIKRVVDDEEKEKIKAIYNYIFESNNKIDIVELCKKFNLKMINKMSQVDTKINLAYFNSRCNNISKHINTQILKNKDDFNLGQIVICRKYYKVKGITLNTNYSYKLKSYKKGLWTIEDETNKITYDISTSLLQNYFILDYCRTINTMQGTSINEKFTIFDLNIPYVSKEHIWVAITRARSLKNVQIFIHNDYEVNSYTYARISQYFNLKIENYKKQDLKANRTFKNEDFIDVNFIVNQQQKTNNKCSYCLKDLEIFINNDNNVISNLTIDRINNKLSHIKTNCKIACLICNVSKK